MAVPKYTINFGWLANVELTVQKWSENGGYYASACLHRIKSKEFGSGNSTNRTYFRITPSSMKRLRRVQDKMIKNNSKKERFRQALKRSMRAEGFPI